MLNQQEPLARSYDEDGFVKVHSVFKTIQGEGPFAGHAAFFIRLFGCNLQCPFCDTEYTDQRQEVSPKQIIDTLHENDWFEPELVVITGGEPFRQNITPLVLMLIKYGFQVQIETNGTLNPGDLFPWDHDLVFVVVSPKTAVIHPEVAKRAHAYKYVLSYDAVHTDGLPTHALGHTIGKAACVARPPGNWFGVIYLNPMDGQDVRINSLNHHAVVESVMKYKKYVMGVQIHKIVGLP